ncbi:hypothetical protein RZP54_29795, partial [Raoultella ornithinolytica]|uniref:hypothetical protein n=1 Tax=Raoultella ornithinolytica TaxID=54291 RepID=UPI00292AEAA9
TVCVVGKMRDLILQLSKSSIYSTKPNRDTRSQLMNQFKDIISSLLPLLEWLQLIQETQGRESTLTAGDYIRLSEIMTRVEDNQSLQQRLNQLSSDRFFNCRSDSIDLQLKQIFRRLKEHGYVRQPNAEQQIFIATGKIDYLIDVIRFIRDEEHLPVEDTPPVQQELL